MPTTARLVPLLALFLFAPIACTAEDGGDGAGATDTAANEEAGAAQQNDSKATPEAIAERVEARMREQRPGIRVESVRESPVSGIYEIVAAGGIYYVTPDAKHLFTGSLIDLEAQTNLTRARQGELAHEVVDGLDRERMVVFEPANGSAEHHITVFTDTTCGYCRRLHREVLDMVAEYPVEVRYAMYPRAGPDSSAADTLRNVWCADDPASAMTRAKEGRSVEAHGSDCETPLDEHLAAANRIGVRGTPYLVMGDGGPVVPGYRPKRELLSLLGIRPGQ